MVQIPSRWSSRWRPAAVPVERMATGTDCSPLDGSLGGSGSPPPLMACGLERKTAGQATERDDRDGGGGTIPGTMRDAHTARLTEGLRPREKNPSTPSLRARAGVAKPCPMTRAGRKRERHREFDPRTAPVPVTPCPVPLPVPFLPRASPSWRRTQYLNWDHLLRFGPDEIEAWLDRARVEGTVAGWVTDSTTWVNGASDRRLVITGRPVGTATGC